MAFADVAFAFKQIVPAAKLTQLRDNIVAHDHRADGSQGAPMQRLPWDDISSELVEEAGWDINGASARYLLDGDLVQLDLLFERTGADIEPNADNGGLANSPLANSLPILYRPAVTFIVPGIVGVDFPGWVSIGTGGNLTLTSSMPGRTIVTGVSLIVRTNYWVA